MRKKKPTNSASTFHFVIGDIHGCRNEMIQLESELTKFAKKQNRNVFVVGVGDLVDRGPDSAGVIEHFRSRRRDHLSLIGNHELMMLETLQEFCPKDFVGLKKPNWFVSIKEQYKWRKGLSKSLSFADFRVLRKVQWLGNGGHETLESYGQDSAKPETWKVPRAHLRYLLSCNLMWSCPAAIVTHALALKKDLQLLENANLGSLHIAKQDLNQAIQSIIWNRDVQTFHKFEKLHLSGHTPVKNPKKLRDKFAIQLDTGCVYGQRLTAYCIEAEKFFTVDSGFTWP